MSTDSIIEYLLLKTLSRKGMDTYNLLIDKCLVRLGVW